MGGVNSRAPTGGIDASNIYCASTGQVSYDLLLWIIVMLVQSIPYLASVVVAVISAFPRLPAKLVCGRRCEEQVRSLND